MTNSSPRVSPSSGPSADPPILQFDTLPGVIDLAWGHPDPELLPVGLLPAAAKRALARYGPDALGYGARRGAGPLLDAIRDRLGVIDARVPALDEILVTAGASGGLDQVATLLCEPGDVVLVESPTYHLAVRILRDHPVELVPVPAGPGGIDVEAVARVASELRRRGRTPRLLYSVTTFSNPAGATLSAVDRRRLADVLAAEDVLLVEDDTYRELWYDEPPPPSVWAVGGGQHVIRLGSFSKTLAPGLRLGYLTAPSAIVSRFVDSGLLDSGGGNGHLVALVVAELFRSGEYARHVDALRAAYRLRRDAVVDALSELDVTFVTPTGGYFAWVDLRRSSGPERLAAARRAGTNFVSGEVFHVGDGGGETHARLSFSRYHPETLREGVRRLGSALNGPVAGADG